MKIKFFTEKREGIVGKNTVAPYFVLPDHNPYNVWEIGEKAYNQDVEDAIVHAFELGYQAAMMTMPNLEIDRKR